jgi:acyl-homoserine lactone acylase PvdQ
LVRARWVAVLVAGVGLALAAPASAAPKDYSQTALNIIPSGQYGGVPPPAGADTQAMMYDALTPRFDHVTGADLSNDFKSEKFGLSTAGPGTVEPVPYPGVTIIRDRFNVPHVTATTHAGGVWAAGWIAAEDRGLLGQQVRYDARIAAVDPPGLSAIGIALALKQFVPSAQTEAAVAKQADVLRHAGKEGKAVLHDIDTFVAGINAYITATGSSDQPWTRNDIFAVNALKDQFFGEGGGDEARRSQFLGGLEHRLGRKKGYSVFNDLRQSTNAGSPTTVDGTFNYDHAPNKPGAPGSVVLDPHSFTPTPAASVPAKDATEPRPHASNELMVEANHSTTGHPLLVGGPQIGYDYPGLTYEIDMHAPGLDWRGATSAPFPGYLLIGRGADFATTLTSAGADDIDQYAETLCDHSDTKYVYKGRCRSMGSFDAGVLKGTPDQEVTFRTTVHGPVIGYATVNGRKVAISSKRASYGKDSLDLLFNRRLSDGQVDSPKSFFKAAALTPQTFNSFYIDSKHVAEYTSGLLPLRPKGVDPTLPTVGTGKYEWQGFLPASKHIHGVDPTHTPVKGTMTNWNNVSAHGFGAADDAWGGNGSAARVNLLNYNLKRLANKHGKWSLASVASAMNAAATQDVRAIETVPLLWKLLKGSSPPNGQAARMMSLLRSWRLRGGNRLDLDNDGKIDNPGAAIMDAAWPKIANAFMRPRLGSQLGELDSLFTRFEAPPGGQYDGWYQYFDRDIRKLLRMKQPQPFANSYCGAGKLQRCRRAVWGAIAAAGKQLTASQGTAEPSTWRADANAERISFAPGLLPFTMRYTNRPSGIQQVISFKGHR